MRMMREVVFSPAVYAERDCSILAVLCLHIFSAVRGSTNTQWVSFFAEDVFESRIADHITVMKGKLSRPAWVQNLLLVCYVFCFSFSAQFVLMFSMFLRMISPSRMVFFFSWWFFFDDRSRVLQFLPRYCSSACCLMRCRSFFFFCAHFCDNIVSHTYS